MRTSLQVSSWHFLDLMRCRNVISSKADAHQSLPFKLIFFVLVDGWSLVAGSLVQSYGG
jgi:hypothetical protein